MIARYAIVLAVLTAAALGACSTGQAAEPSSGAPLPPVGVGAREVAPASVALRPPKDVVELFTTRMLPTCALNDGVCHNANNYPDLRNVAALADLVDLPCGRDSELEIRDACEPPGDRLVADAAVDVVVERVAFDETSNVATITTAADLPQGVLAHVEIRRSATDRVLAASAEGVTFIAVGPRTITAQLVAATPAARRFFEPKLPMREDRIWAADMNGNGVAGASVGWREIVPGRPDRSWIVARLWNTELDPELMPRQCRAWNDSVTRSLACWVEQLRTDEHGTPTNFFEPIDYAACTFTVPTEGRCGPGP